MWSSTSEARGDNASCSVVERKGKKVLTGVGIPAQQKWCEKAVLAAGALKRFTGS